MTNAKKVFDYRNNKSPLPSKLHSSIYLCQLYDPKVDLSYLLLPMSSVRTFLMLAFSEGKASNVHFPKVTGYQFAV